MAAGVTDRLWEVSDLVEFGAWCVFRECTWVHPLIDLAPQVREPIEHYLTRPRTTYSQTRSGVTGACLLSSELRLPVQALSPAGAQHLHLLDGRGNQFLHPLFAE